VEGAGDRWRLFVALVQATWERRNHAYSDELGGDRAPPKRGGGGITVVLDYLTPCGKL
jgi:hypothetical protein